MSALTVLTARQVESAVRGAEEIVMRAVEQAYIGFREGRAVLPPSSFLKFHADRPDRIIALPAYLSDDPPIAGMKWIGSVPANVERGMDRASALIVVNDVDTGRPTAVLEASLISAARTAASAAVAARALHGNPECKSFGIIGCGLIGLEVARYITFAFPSIQELVLYDLRRPNAEAFQRRAQAELGVNCRIADSANATVSTTRLVALTTVASKPHLDCALQADHTVLNISLRDLAPRMVLESDNIVDDIEHILQSQTSPHLASLQVNHHDFIRASLADVLTGDAPARVDGLPCVFSPYGMGILDLAVARVVMSKLHNVEGVHIIDNFLPEPWSRS